MRNILGWLFSLVWLVISVLNVWLVHVVPGIFYGLLAVIYFPPVDEMIKKRWGFIIPLSVKVIVGLVVLWGTLAVGDLAEVLGL